MCALFCVCRCVCRDSKQGAWWGGRGEVVLAALLLVLVCVRGLGVVELLGLRKGESMALREDGPSE